MRLESTGSQVNSICDGRRPLSSLNNATYNFRTAPQHRARNPAGPSASPAGRTSSSVDEDAERSLWLQVASFAELENLTRENRDALEEIRQLVEHSTTGGASSGTGSAKTDTLRELDRLMAVAKDLDEMMVRAAL